MSMAPRRGPDYPAPMRVNLLALAAMAIVLAGMQAQSHHYPAAIFVGAAGVFLVVVHFIRARRLKRYEQSRKLQAFE